MLQFIQNEQMISGKLLLDLVEVLQNYYYARPRLL